MPIAESVLGAAHSLLDQSLHAREQTSGTENPDGWGYGFYPDDGGPPVRYRSPIPLVDDADGRAGLDGVCADRFLAHVRHKSPGSPTEEAGNAPFLEGRWLFAHNGFLADYQDGEGDRMRAALSPARRARLQGAADSEVLFGLVLDRIDAGADPLDAMVEVIEPLSGPDRDRGKFNLLLTDGTELLASRWGNSLHLRIDDRGGRRAVTVASEPLDDAPAWDAVPDRTLVRIDAGGVELIPH